MVSASRGGRLGREIGAVAAFVKSVPGRLLKVWIIVLPKSYVASGASRFVMAKTALKCAYRVDCDLIAVARRATHDSHLLSLETRIVGSR